METRSWGQGGGRGEDGSANYLVDAFSLCFQPLLQHPEKGTELPQHA
jgi:hypothetical protein